MLFRHSLNECNTKMPLSREECKFIAQNCEHMSTKTLCNTLGQARGETNPNNYPSRRSVNKAIEKWHKYARVDDRRCTVKASSGAKDKLDTSTKEAIREYALSMPMSSQRHIASFFGIARDQVRKALNAEPRIKPYRLRKMQKLTDQHQQQRKAYCQEALALGEEYQDKIWYSDECSIHTGRKYVNSQNVRYYAESLGDVPDEFYADGAQSQSGSRFMVWAAMRKGRRLTWYVYPAGTTVNARSYVRMLGSNFFGGRNGSAFRVGDVFMQDGAPAHTADSCMRYLGRKTLRVISRRNSVIIGCTDPAWPPCSPDLTPCDFWLWSRLRQLLFAGTLPTTDEGWRQKINECMTTIANDQAMLDRAVGGITSRLRECVEQEGAHFEHLR